MNLIPNAPGLSPNYWCTWSTQNFGREDEHPDYHNYLGGVGSQFARAEMNEKNLLRWLQQFPKNPRGSVSDAGRRLGRALRRTSR